MSIENDNVKLRVLVRRLADELRDTIDAWCKAEGNGHKIADHEPCGDERCYECATNVLLAEADEWTQQ